MPVVAQLLARSPKPHRSRVRFQTKKTHWSSRLRPGHWVDIPIPLITSLLKKKIKIEFTTRQMLRIQAGNGQGPLGMEEDCIQSQGPQRIIVPLEEQVECKSYPCAVHDRLQGHTKDLDNETAAAKKQKHTASLKR